MYKIVTNITEITAINNAVKVKENNETSSYCQINKHCKDELYAIPIINSYLLSLVSYCPFITNEWLTTDVVEELPKDWTWKLMDRPIRLVMTTNFITDILLSNTDLTLIIKSKIEENAVLSDEDSFIVKDEANTIAYFNEVKTDINPLTGKSDYDVIMPYVMTNKIKIETL